MLWTSSRDPAPRFRNIRDLVQQSFCKYHISDNYLLVIIKMDNNPRIVLPFMCFLEKWALRELLPLNTQLSFDFLCLQNGQYQGLHGLLLSVFFFLFFFSSHWYKRNNKKTVLDSETVLVVCLFFESLFERMEKWNCSD